jgi:hypothetical protein
MPSRLITDALIDTNTASCGPVCISAIVGVPISRIELVLRCDGRDVRATNAYDLAHVLDAFGYTLLDHEWFADPLLLGDWVEDRDLLTYAGSPLILLVAGRDGATHWLAHRGEAWLCDGATTGGRWQGTEGRDLDRWSVLSVLSVDLG